ncbi:VOC family protein [Enterococcus sp. LJL128]|uniref:VOC family protein n=1 Tax=Enterococcus sp. LJL51 TaxID=3416656 RepID=UPI003CE6ADA6
MDVYLMPMFNKLMVKDIQKAAAWYTDLLGFTSLFAFKNENNEVSMNHLRLKNYQDIMLIQSEAFTAGDGLRMNLTVDHLHELAERIPEKFIIEALEKQPWNAEEMTIRDCDGYLITLTQAGTETTDSFETVIDRVSEKFN